MPDKTKIIDIMTKGIFSVKLTDRIKKADAIMKNEGVRHVPVLDSKKYIGMITDHSIMEFTLKNLYDFDEDFGDSGHNKIRDYQNVMSKDTHMIYPEDSVKKACEIMIKKKVNSLPVVDWEKNLVGLVTKHDLLLFLNKILGND